jgi:hypothetical protein
VLLDKSTPLFQARFLEYTHASFEQRLPPRRVL